MLVVNSFSRMFFDIYIRREDFHLGIFVYLHWKLFYTGLLKYFIHSGLKF